MIDKCLIIFTRNPVAGQVKRRLIPEIGAQNAALLQQKLTNKILGMARTLQNCDVHVWVAEEKDQNYSAYIQDNYGFIYHQQIGADLGERMSTALNYHLHEYNSAVLVGSDCPALDDSIIKDAFVSLQSGNDVVMGPSVDGGYYLIGMTQPTPCLFQKIQWGCETVAEQTRVRMRANGICWSEMPELHDIDRPADLDLLDEDYLSLFSKATG